MARIISVLTAVLLATSALAQTTTTQTITDALIVRTQTSDFQDQITFGPSDCATTFTVRYKYTPTLGTACSDITFFATDLTSCPDTQRDGDLFLKTVSYLTLAAIPQGNFDVKVPELPGFVAQTLEDGGVTTVTTACGDLGKEKIHLVCGSANAGTLGSCVNYGSTTTKLKASPLKLKYDTLPPSAPSITEVLGTNGTATLTFTINADATYAEATVTEVSTDGGVDVTTQRPQANAETGKVKVTGLTNGVPYILQLRFIDAAGNVGPLSDAVGVTPVRTVGFWGVYKDAGGTDEGGCSVSWGLMPMLAALLFMMRRSSR